MIIPSETISFKDFVEYADLEDALENDRDFSVTEVEEPYSNIGLEEKWFKNTVTEEVWRLVRPDPPFRGNWSKVK